MNEIKNGYISVILLITFCLFGCATGNNRHTFHATMVNNSPDCIRRTETDNQWKYLRKMYPDRSVVITSMWSSVPRNILDISEDMNPLPSEIETIDLEFKGFKLDYKGTLLSITVTDNKGETQHFEYDDLTPYGEWINNCAKRKSRTIKR